MENEKICAVLKVKNIETASVYLLQSFLLKRKRKKCRILLMSTEGQLVNCMYHTHFFIQT